MSDASRPFSPNHHHPLHTVPGQCPVCASELHVTRLECATCGTGIDGHFRLNRFSRLSPDHLAFLETFVKNRGIIKDVEAELGISYPTVRARLDDVIRALGFPAQGEEGMRPSQAREERRQILEALRNKEISAEQAASRLAALGDRKGAA
ncbi:MAG: DUF2089 domain-containing protein [Thermomicrobiales bacterium]